MSERFESYSQQQVPKVEMKGMRASTEQLEQQKAKEINEALSGFRAEFGALKKEILPEAVKTDAESIDATQKTEAAQY